MPRVREKPPEVDALQWDGTNTAEIQTFCGDSYPVTPREINTRPILEIQTHRERERAAVSDWFIKDPRGEITTETDEIYKETHENLDGSEI